MKKNRRHSFAVANEDELQKLINTELRILNTENSVPESLISFPDFTDLAFFLMFKVKSLGVPSSVNDRLKYNSEKY